jgi:DtxR family Mn-dependent transcriptional regulator
MINPWLLVLVAILAAGIGGALLWPGRGVVSRWRRAARSVERDHAEDILKHLYETEIEGTASGLQATAGATRRSVDGTAALLRQMEARGLVSIERDGIRLTDTGREMGLHVLRAHRLWESYLADETGFPETEWHGRAHELEHGLSRAEVDRLSARLKHPTHDPHGDPIPTAAGELAGARGIPLTSAPLGRALRILHLEDEPAAVYGELVDLGLQPGVTVQLLEASPRRVRLSVGGAERLLTPLAVSGVSVLPLAAGAAGEEPIGEPLDALRPGEAGRVLAVSRRCRGAERRRLLDLGILPGTILRAELRSPNGDPTAYRVRGALIALRAEQARFIQIERVSDQAAEAA